MRRQDLPRTPSMHSIPSVTKDSVRKGDSMALVPVNEHEQSYCSLESWEYNKAFSGSRFPNKKVLQPFP